MTRASIAIGIALAIGCGGPSGTNLERSCRGEVVLDCDPHTYTVGTSASFEPSSIRPGDTMSSAQIRFDYDRCAPGAPDAGAGSPAEVQVSAVYETSPGDVRVVDLGIVLRDDATGGAAGDGVIEGEVTNPLALDVPGDADITLRFVPVYRGCTGEAVEIDYHTGARATL